MSYIKTECADKIRESADIVKVVGRFVELKKVGANYKASSPFATDKTPSFIVSPAKQIFKCFSSGLGGDAFKFVMEHQRVNFPEALKIVGEIMAVPIEYENAEWAQKKAEETTKKDALREILTTAHKLYQKELQKLPDDHPAKLEIQRRGYGKDEVIEYGIGYAPGGPFLFDRLAKASKTREGRKLGLIGEKADKFWDRVIYPIHDRNGLLVGFAGRDVSGKKDSAKWINPIESEMYLKDKIWYGMHLARNAIARTGKAYLVEGYNDVIAFQSNGVMNTVAGCGTAITENQMLALKKLTSHVVLALDPDNAGIKSALKHIPVFLKNGFRVQVLKLPVDPDDFVRDYKEEIEKQKGLEKLISQKEYTIDGFKFLMDNYLVGDEITKAIQAELLAKVLATIEDKSYREIYVKWLAKESGLEKRTVESFIRGESLKAIDQVNETHELYQLPKSVKVPIVEIEKTIEKYQLFMANNKIWMQRGSEPPYTFESVSNFAIEIIQHMRDEKFPMKLLRIKNTDNMEVVFDMPSDQINTPMSFDNAMTAHGNYFWTGGRSDHQRLRKYLFDKMGTGRKIDVLGWQPEGFWAWNNKASVADGTNIDINENGVFEFNKVTYYIPSANSIYKDNPYKYQSQKKAVIKRPNFNFSNYITQMMKVHRGHAITATLFGIASAFQDIVVHSEKFFPMLFLYGPASSGKDQLANCVQSFFGDPQEAINLEGGVSTIKAQVREFAQFSNMISQLSEYKPGDAKLDGVLKGLWDRRGYKRGNIDSHVGTDSIPILSSVIMTGNYTPDQEALITRLIWEEMSKTSFSEEENKAYEQLADMTAQGLSQFVDDLIRHRGFVQDNFQRLFREAKNTLNERMQDAPSRLISNISVLIAFYQLFKDIVFFPFSMQDALDHFAIGVEKQVRKLNSASVINRWWDCFLASMRGTKDDKLLIHRDYKLDGNTLYFNFTMVYNKIQRQWWSQYHENAPGKASMQDVLKKNEGFMQEKSSVRIGQGKEGTKTSAYVIDLNSIGYIGQEVKDAINFQLDEMGLIMKDVLEEKETENKTPDGLSFSDDDNEPDF